VKCFLTGSTGNLGKELLKIASDFGIEYCVSGGRSELDISDKKSTDVFVMWNYNKIFGVEKVVHCAAYTNVPGAETHRQEAIDTNIIGTKNVVKQICGKFKVPIVYISTDYVYPGIDGYYDENSSTDPINFYAFTKLAGEAYASSQKDLIIRTSFKPVVWKNQKAFFDIHTSADYIDIIAKKISYLISHNAEGTYNVGTERKSVLDLALRRNPEIQPMPKNEVVGVQLPSDVSMNTKKFEDFLTK